MKKNILFKKENLLVIGFLAILQIVLLSASIFAGSYLISSSNNPLSGIDIGKDKKAGKFGFNFLIGLLSIKQIGVVSAQSSEVPATGCCVKANSGAVCLSKIINTDGSAPDYCDESDSIFLPQSCEEVQECQTGCYIPDGAGSCSLGARKISVDESKGKFISGDNSCESDSARECGYGCCVGSEIQYVQKKTCDSEKINSPDVEFFPGEDQFQCISRINKNDDEKRACVYLEGRACSFVSPDECQAKEGVKEIAPKGVFCTSASLKNLYSYDYESADHTGCEGRNLYNYDDHNNREDLKEACGLEKKCALNGQGIYACISNGCTDENGDKRISGESWCSYEGPIGNQTEGGRTFSSDIPGTEHWKRECIDGEILSTPSLGRNNVCSEVNITRGDGNGVVSMANLVPNEAVHCFNTQADYFSKINKKMESFECIKKQKCEKDDIKQIKGKLKNLEDEMRSSCLENSHCRIQKLEVSKNFNQTYCVPKYPKGRDLRVEEYDPKKDVTGCSFGTVDCKATFIRETEEDWDCIDNCECLTGEFLNNANDLCLSLGDCGSYVNINGNYTKNYKLKIDLPLDLMKNDDLTFEQIADNDSDVDLIDEINWKTYKKLKKNMEKKEGFDYGGNTYPGFNPDIYSALLKTLQDSPEEIAKQNVEPQSLDLLLQRLGVGEFNSSEGGTVADISDAQRRRAQITATKWAMGIAGAGGTVGVIVGAVGAFNSLATVGSGTSTFLHTIGIGANSIGLGGFLIPSLFVTLGALLGAGIGLVIVKSTGKVGPVASWMVAIGAVGGGGLGLSVGIIIIGGANAWNAAGWVLLAAAAIIELSLALTELGETTDIGVSFECLPWQAPKGGEDCSSCTEGEFECTKYKCESLGQTCEFKKIDDKVEGKKDNVVCESVEQINEPLNLTLNKEKSSKDFKYGSETPNLLKISASDDGKIIEYTKVSFALDSNRRAECRYGTSSNFENMASNEGGGYYKTHHFEFEKELSLDNLEGIDGNGCLTEYILCEDFQENPIRNIPAYRVKLCLDRFDVSLPVREIQKIEPAPESMLPFETIEKIISLTLDRSVKECRYSTKKNVNYEGMEGSSSCSNKRSCDINLPLSPGENSYYFKCNSSNGVVNIEDLKYEGESKYKLRVSESKLKIDSVTFTNKESGKIVKSEGTLETDGKLKEIILKIETSEGASGDGSANCGYYWANGRTPNFIKQIASNQYKGSLNLIAGTFSLKILCIDSGGEKETKDVTFTIEADTTGPKITSIYKDSSSLKLITDEEAKCYYDYNSCNFKINESTPKFITGLGGFDNSHTAGIDSNKEYNIICADRWENKGSCLTVKAFN